VRTGGAWGHEERTGQVVRSVDHAEADGSLRQADTAVSALELLTSSSQVVLVWTSFEPLVAFFAFKLFVARSLTATLEING